MKNPIGWISLCLLLASFPSQAVSLKWQQAQFEKGRARLHQWLEANPLEFHYPEPLDMEECAAQLMDIAFGPVGSFALMTGNEKYSTRYMGIGILINIALNLLLTPRMGLNGTAIATSCSIVFWNAAMFITIRKKTGIRTWIWG